MAELFGLHPWDIDRLTYPQWCRFRARADAVINARKG